MWVRRMLAWWAGLLAVAAGVGWGLQNKGVQPVGCLGDIAYAPPRAVNLVSAQVTPSPNARPGQTIKVMAYTDYPAIAASLQFKLKTYGVTDSKYDGALADAFLRDDGKGGDRAASDGEWYGECKCPGPLGGSLALLPQVTISYLPVAGQPARGPYTLSLPCLFVIDENEPANDERSAGSSATNQE